MPFDDNGGSRRGHSKVKHKLDKKSAIKISPWTQGFIPAGETSDDDEQLYRGLEGAGRLSGGQVPSVSSVSALSYKPMSHPKNVKQNHWIPPVMVHPEGLCEQDVDGESSVVDHGALDTDAVLYVIREKTVSGDKVHSVLQMPSCVPTKLSDTELKDSQASSTYNILMADVSGSMAGYWKSFMDAWNKYVAPNLVGRTNLYVFGNSVVLKRSGTKLLQRDFDGGGTDLTGALQTIVTDVYQCKERYINVFLITDGHHNATEVNPETVIEQMQAAVNKKCDIYVLGAGSAFPVQYSINIRSRLHNGSSNLPSLFWAREYKDMENQVKDIGNKITSGSSQSLRLSVAGCSLPGKDTQSIFHLKEWVYFPFGPEQVRQVTLSKGRHTGHISLEPRQMPIFALLEVFRQWNSVIIQIHNKKETVPPDTLSLMERLFSSRVQSLQGVGAKSIAERLARKEQSRYETEFRTLLNKIRAILTTEKFHNELELAENILSTTVGGGKYGTKVLKMKGHTDEDYKKDCDKFMKICENIKTSIQSITSTPEDCCRITLASTVSDLQDPDFPMMMDLNKFEFLREFTISGIPVFTPSRDSVNINPWLFGIEALVGAPYTILSQVALENFAHPNPVRKCSKDVHLKINEKTIRCNAVIPVFSPEAAKVMAPLVHTRLYSMCTTFAILKNPFILDFNVHMAGLAVTWVRILFEHPTQPRPEFVCRRIASIEATAALYLGRPSYTKYWDVLKSDSAQALMTESVTEVDNRVLKCESLVKPMFLLHMYQQSENFQDTNVVAKIVKLILIEYIGRCLSNYKTRENEAMPFTDFFAETLTDQDRKKEWIKRYIADTKESMAGSENLLLEDFYTLEKVQKAAKKTAVEQMKNLKEKMTAQIPIAVNVKKVGQLRSVSTAGDVSWFTLQTFAREVGLTEDVVDDLFSEQHVFVYTAHALQYRSSKERLTSVMLDYDASHALVTKRVQEENARVIAKDLYTELINHLQSSWLEAYSAAHREMVQPMTRQQILAEAPLRGVEVTDATFDQVYKRYRADVGLMGNACQCRACPYFLIPNKRYNQHSSVERRGPAAFPHGLHGVTYRQRDSGVSTILSSLETGQFFTPVPREACENLASDVEMLKEVYKETHTSDLPASTQPPSGVGGNIQVV